MADPGLPPQVVGIGASAGGLQATIQLLAHLPEGVAFAVVLIQHLDRQHPSELAELLARSGKLPVTWISDHTRVRPGQVYVLPPDREVRIERGRLILGHRRTESVVRTIDYFFRSLAEDLQSRAVAVILSGSGSDGAAGLSAVKAAGGRAYVQEESTASSSGMLRAAIDSGEVDGIFSPERIAEELVRLSQAALPGSQDEVDRERDPPTDEAETWAAIFRVLSARKAVDFSKYKPSTIRRRLVRRMALARIYHLPDYLKLLLRNREEVDALYDNLLINVTSFFRDPENFDFLKEHVFPRIIAEHARDGSPIRIWVPGCSTGEEAYSLAMLLRETFDQQGQVIPVQIFATDLSERVIEHARNGLYSTAEVDGISPERLGRHFITTPRGSVVQKALRDMCVFARQNVTKDSPFSRLDLVSCRNLLIYLGAELQKKVLPIFHYALKPEGYLVLGTSESVGAQVDLFRLVDRNHRVYRRKAASGRRIAFDIAVDPRPIPATRPPLPPLVMSEDPKNALEIMREADRVVLGRHGPPGVLLNETLEILQFRGNVSPYLAPMAGRASLSLMKMAVEGLAAELESAVNEAKQSQVRIRRSGIIFTQNEATRTVDLDVTPLNDGREGERFYLVLFIASGEKEEKLPQSSPAVGRKEKLAQIEQLKQDLQAARNYLQSTIEKHEATNQQLRAANEEIQSSNEELQSTNEELETAKEELQSTNEELTTVNEELHNRQGELIQANNDLTNLINSVHLPIIILGPDMRIRRFTPMAEHVLNVIPTDVGRPLSDLNFNLSVTNLPRLLSEVVDSLTVREMEVQDHQGRWYSMRLRPYKTAENKIEGVVMTLIDIDQIKRAIGELEDARLLAHELGEILPEALVAVNGLLEVRVASPAFHQLFGTSSDRSYGRLLLDTVPQLREAPEFNETLTRSLASGVKVVDRVIELTPPGAGKRRFAVTFRPLASSRPAQRSCLLSFRPLESSSP